MKFSELSVYLEKLDQTTSRNEMIEILADVLKKASVEEVGSMMYLLQGRVAPIYVNLELGMADKMVMKAIIQAYDGSEGEMEQQFKKVGDVGLVAEEYARKAGQTSGVLSVQEVFDILKEIAEASGAGSVEVKVGKLAKLFQHLDPLSVRYVARIPVGRLRLGFSDMTVLDSLSWMIEGTKAYRKEIERAFNVRPDLGFIVTTVKKEGIEGLENVKPAVFTLNTVIKDTQKRTKTVSET